MIFCMEKNKTLSKYDFKNNNITYRGKVFVTDIFSVGKNNDCVNGP